MVAKIVQYVQCGRELRLAMFDFRVLVLGTLDLDKLQHGNPLDISPQQDQGIFQNIKDERRNEHLQSLLKISSARLEHSLYVDKVKYPDIRERRRETVGSND